MTGPDHFRAAEKILAGLHEIEANSDAELPVEMGLALATAQVHAILANAAASAMAAALPLMGDDQQVTEWARAIGMTPETNQGNRISATLALIDEFERNDVIKPGAADELRAALGQDGGA